MSLYDEIRKVAQESPTKEATDLATALLQRLPREELTDLIAHEIRQVQRSLTRVNEQEAFAMLFAAPSGERPALSATPQFRRLFSEEFHVGDGSRTTWGKATIDQHRFRVQFLTNQIDGLIATRARHEWAVQILEETGANCLEDISGEPIPITV